MKLPQEEFLLTSVLHFLAESFSLPLPRDEILEANLEELISYYRDDPSAVSISFARLFLLENLSENVYNEKVLKCLIEEYKPLRGYFFLFEDESLPRDYTFFKAKNLHFYPLMFGNSQSLFLSLWKRGVPFVSLYKEILSFDEIPDVEDDLKVISELGFTRLTKKGIEAIRPVLMLHREWKKIAENVSLSNILFVSASVELDEVLKELSCEVLLKDAEKEFYYVLRGGSTAELIRELTSRTPKDAVLGYIPGERLKDEPFCEFSPFLLAFSALEHAGRAGERIISANGFSLHVLGDIVYELEDLAFAKRVYEVAKKYTLQPIELTLSLASIHYTLEDLDTAEKLLRGRLCGCVKEDPMVHHNLGLIYLAKNNLPSAEYHFYKAHLLDPENVILRERLVQFLFDQGKTGDVLQILEGKEVLSPKEMLILGKVYFRQGEYDKALKFLSQLLDKPERDGEASMYLAWLYFNLRKNEEVAKVFLNEAEAKLSSEEFVRLKEELNL